MVSAGLPNAIITGLVTGSILALGAIGVALIYRIADVPNFAHGELFTFGAYVALLVNVPGEFLLMSPFVEEGGIGIEARLVLSLLGASSTLATFYLLGGRGGLEGDWWPSRPPPAVGLAAHGALALAIGTIVFVTTPSLWGGFVLAAPLVAVVGLLQERYVYRYFRDRGAELATLLIVALGLSIFLRNSISGLFTGSNRSFDVANTVPAFGTEVYFATARLYDVYFSGGGVTLVVTDTGPATNVVLHSLSYAWPVVLTILVVTVAAPTGYLWYRFRRQIGHRGGETFDPRIKAGVLGFAVLVIGGLLLSSRGSPPAEAWYSTRIRLSVLKTFMVVGTVVVIAGLHVMLQETKLGTAMRASSDNLDLARVRGINTGQVMMVTWIIAGVLGAVGGIMLGLLFNRVVPTVGFNLLLPMFAAVILGGGGRVSGAIVGSYIVGLSEEVGLFVIPGASPSYRVPIAFAVLVIVLLLKPEGITGGR